MDSPELDARLLLGAVLDLDLTGLISQAARLLTPQDIAALERALRRRIAGEPVARILGVREFWGLPFRLSPDTLVPRPDTETVIEAVLDIVRANAWQGRALRILDVGTGSGAILLALLHELPDAFGVGIDISGKVNTGLMDENRALAQQIDMIRTGLQALQGRDDLTPQAKDQVSLMLEGLK